ncbi:MAG: hypothetical protein WCH34_02855 [Bacteroidota bacterium]
MHPHHHPDIRKKNFKEYIFEGLMIFMAVTMGFFAEKIRENMAEHSKEKEFIYSMIEDAQTDLINIQKTVTLNKKRVIKLETLANICFNYSDKESTNDSLYKVIKDCIRHPDFVNLIERTLTQLKNAGAMRLIQNKVAVDSIIFYDDVAKKLVNQQTYYENHLNILLDGTEHLFNLKHFPLDPTTLKWKPNPEVFSSPQLITQDKTKLIEFGNKAKLFQGIVIFYLLRLEEANLHAINLIKTLKKEYEIN